MTEAAAAYEAAVQFYQRGQLAEAARAGESAVKQDRRHGDAMTLLGLVAFAQGDFEGARTWHERALRMDRKSPLYLTNYATALVELGRLSDAMNAYERALKQRPDLEFAVAGLAKALEHRHRLGRAREVAEGHYTKHGGGPALLAVLARIEQREGNHDRVLTLAAEAAAHAGRDPIPQRELCFIAGQSHERQGQYDQAFAAFARGNQMLAQPYDHSQTEAYFASVKRVFSAEAMADMAWATRETELPVMVVGMPRSGSTLIEQIIHAHPNGCGAGELNDFPAVVRGLDSQDLPYPDIAATATPAQLDSAVRPYLQSLKRIGRGATRVVDKALSNFIHLGLIRMMLPGASVVHARRHPLATCLSCFAQNLSPRMHPWSTDLKMIVQYYRSYAELMAHWRSTDLIHMLEVQYESLATDQATWTRRLIDFVDLPWDDACMEFHTVKRAVTTSSYEQVSQPMYQSAIARYEHYGALLDPLRDELGDLADAEVTP